MIKEYLILLAVIINLFLGFFVYFKNRKDPVNLSFLLFSLSASAWSLAIFFYTNPLIFDSLLWIKVTYFLSLFTVPAFFYFAALYSKKPSIFYTKPIILYFLIILPFIYFLFGTNWWIVSVVKMSWGYHTVTGFIYPFFGALAGIYLFFTFRLLFQKLRTDIKTEKNQTFYIILGIFFYSLFSFVLDVMLPVLFGISKYFWASPVAAFFFIGFTTLAITKYHLFEIKVILTEILVSVLGMGLIFQIIFSENIRSRFIAGGVFIFFLVTGYLLIKSTHQEIARREEIEKLLKDLEDANIQIQSVEKMKSDLINMASHEFRTPIGIIKNALWFMNKPEIRETLAPKGKTNLDIMNHSIERLDIILQNITGVLEASLGELVLKVSPTQIEILINDVIRSKQSEAEEKRVSISFKEPAKPLPQINADQTKIKYVFWELLNNALKYTSNEDIIKITAVKKDGMIVIEINDSGSGIPADKLDGIFHKPFIKADYLHNTQAGMGLGLYVIKNIVDLHGGEIEIESKINSGTKVIVKFPYKDED